MHGASGTDPVRITVPVRLAALDGLRGEVPPVADVARVDPHREPAELAPRGRLLVDAGQGKARRGLIRVERLVADSHRASFLLNVRPSARPAT